MPEIRFEAADQDVAVLDGYCSARGKCRTEVIKQILEEWSNAKLHEATLIVRFAGHLATSPENNRK